MANVTELDYDILCTTQCKCPYCGSRDYYQWDTEYPYMKCKKCNKIFWSD